MRTLSVSAVTDHVQWNRAIWDGDAENWVERGRRSWAQTEPAWGTWHVPDSELRVLPDVAGRDVVELGCGTAYFSSWLARRGARVVGIDNSRRQLATAQRFQSEFGLEFPLIHADAEHVPLASESFDLALSEYGAAIWCDPYVWIPEAARLLRKGGRLIFLGNAVLAMLCMPETEAEAPAGDRLLRDQFGMYRFEWPGEEGIEFHLAHGDMLRLLRSNGFEVEDLIEIQAPEGTTSPDPYISNQWARRWPSEEIWKARKR
jgi:SAM-dependent methyltransferase